MSKLKQIREQQSLTQEELAEKSRISVRTIQRIESGSVPKGYTLKTLATILQISENELLHIEEEKSEEIINELVEDLVIESNNIDYQKVKLINLS
ncbi:helix-turn-helix domain-containing protein, partial [Algoriella sp.]